MIFAAQRLCVGLGPVSLIQQLHCHWGLILICSPQYKGAQESQDSDSLLHSSKYSRSRLLSIDQLVAYSDVAVEKFVYV